MGIAFSKLKAAGIGMLDTLTFGKYTSCRVCDVLEDDYEYFLWLKSKGHLLSKELEECITELKTAAAYKINLKEEVLPYTQPYSNIDIEDIPF